MGNGANLGSIAGQSPAGRAGGSGAKGWIKNLVLEEDESTFSFMFRPPVFRESISAVYGKMRGMGMSHQYHSFSHTDNIVFSFEIYDNALMAIKNSTRRRESGRGSFEGSKDDLESESSMIEEDRRFLESLLYPYEAPGGTIGAEPPPVLLVIPGIVTMRARLLNLTITFQDCDINGNIKAFTANVTFEEAPMARVTMLDQLEVGTFRTWGG